MGAELKLLQSRTKRVPPVGLLVNLGGVLEAVEAMAPSCLLDAEALAGACNKARVAGREADRCHWSLGCPADGLLGAAKLLPVGGKVRGGHQVRAASHPGAVIKLSSDGPSLRRIAARKLERLRCCPPLHLLGP